MEATLSTDSPTSTGSATGAIVPRAPRHLQQTADISRVWFTRREAADYVRLKESTLASFASRGGGPPFVKQGRIVRYQRVALDRWLTNCD